MIENERTRLTAAYLNGLAIAIFAVGGFAPIVSYAYASKDGQPLWVIVVVTLICVLGSVALHLLARHRLGGLIE